jgi:hypothetical protein
VVEEFAISGNITSNNLRKSALYGRSIPELLGVQVLGVSGMLRPTSEEIQSRYLEGTCRIPILILISSRSWNSSPSKVRLSFHAPSVPIHRKVFFGPAGGHMNELKTISHPILFTGAIEILETAFAINQSSFRRILCRK